MAFFDIVLFVLLAYGFGRGLWNGFFGEFASLVSLLIAIFIVMKFSSVMRDLIAPHVSWSPQGIQVMAFLLTFIVVVIGIALLAKFFTGLANLSGLGLINTFLGGFFGLFRMALILGVALNLLQKAGEDIELIDQQTADTSIFFNPLTKSAQYIYPSLLEWIKDLRPVEEEDQEAI